MKTLPKFLFIALLSLAGCSSTSSNSSSPSNSSSTNTTSTNMVASESTQSNSSTSSSSTSSQSDVFAQALNWQSLFEKAGFTISDIERENNEVSFNAYQGGNWIDAEIQNPFNAQNAFQDDLDLNDNENQVVSSYQSDGAQLVVIKDLEEQEYEIVALDETQGFVYTVDGIAESQLQSVLDILSNFNLPISE